MEEKVFHFQDRKALTLQSDEACTNLYENFRKVVKRSTLLQDNCNDLYQQLLTSSENIQVTWFARYGAAMLAQKDVEASRAYITVVGLDGWKSKIHASQHGREVTAIPDLADPAILDVGWIPTDSLPKVEQYLDGKLKQSEKEKSRFKNHKTPSFVWSKILDVLVDLEMGPMTKQELAGISESYQGGTTDVGLHTGCLPRNTSFPLVASVISVILTLDGDDEEHGDFYTVLSAYYLQKLSNLCKHTRSYDRQNINRGVVIIREIRRVLLRVKDVKFQELVVNKIDTCHQHLTSFQPQIDSSISRLSSESLVIDGKELVTAAPFPMVPCLESPNGDPVSRINRARNLAKRNLQWSNTQFFDYPTEDVQQNWMGLANCNSIFWDFARDLNDNSSSIDMETIKPWLEAHDSAIEALLNASQDCIHVMTVELKSLGVLASWIAFCWAHRIATEIHSEFLRYSAALDPADLKHLVLRDKDAIDAAREVRLFLEKHRQSNKVPFRNHEDTLDLALAIGLTSKRHLEIYTEEHTAAVSRIEQRFANIVETQQKLQNLDSQLAKARKQAQTANKDLNESLLKDYYISVSGIQVYTVKYYSIVKAKTAADGRVNNLHQQVLGLDKKPPDVFFPLPRDRNKALQWLFFLFMPSEFLDVTSFAHRAQCKLWNREPMETPCQQNLSDWFIKWRSTVGKEVESGQLIFGSSSPGVRSPLEHRFGIRQYGKESGIFFPDSYNITPSWLGGDPFEPCYRKEVALNFTESLPTDPHLQKYLVMSPSPTRGNLGIATKNEKPDWLSHEEYMMFTSLRAFPNLQFRQLLVAMIDDNLPFHHSCVHTLVRQLLYQVGDEGWKTDLSCTAVLDRIAEQLNRHADLLQEASNNANRLLLFGTLASYLGQFDESCLVCSQRYTRICRDLADQVQLEIQNNEKVSPDIYWKQAKLYGCALICHSNADQSTDTLLGLVELIILFRQKRLLARDASNSDELDNLIQCVMAKKMDNIISELVYPGNLHCRLTEIIRLVIDDVPSGMSWDSMVFDETTSTACFEASGSHHYSVNLLNGTFLVDGVPPGFLPSSAMNDELYKRTFGLRNFECVVEGDSHYRTAKPVGGQYRYDFKLIGDELIIFECERPGGIRIQHASRGPGATTAMPETMPTDNQVDSNLNQGDDEIKLRLLPRGTIPLPPLLVEPYSHWYSEKHKAVFIRDAFYRSREVRFVMTGDATYCVPASDISLPIPTIMSRLDEYERLVLSKLPALPVLSRIEESQYILPWVDQASSCIRYSLPRLHLDFCQMSSKITSVNFDRFVLRESQTLEDVLPGVTSYLVLVDPNGKEIVLIPCGEIYDDGDISVPQNWDMKLRFHTYRIHRRFRHLMANDDLARLQLAGMYAAASCQVAQSQSTKTGMQMAIELVRQCWTNEKLSPSVKSKLIEVSELSGLSCSLRLICAWIWASSDRLSFLREESGQDDNPLEPWLELDPLAVREYREGEYREVVLPSEESLFLASRRRMKATSDLKSQDDNEIQDFVAAVEMELWENMVVAKPSSNLGLQFPLDGPNRPTDIERRIQADLMSSWDAYSSLDEYIVSRDHDLCFRKLQEVKQKREDKENMCLNAVSANGSTEFRLRLLTGSVRSPSTLDLLCIVLDENHFEHLNLALSSMDRTSIRERAVEWMILCVLEDKVRRILEAPNNHVIKEETRCLRGWDPWSHLRWLAFEVEQQIQIRPYQYSIVQQLLDDPRSMTQLNMGLGKTSVLIPMFILELTKSKASVVRVNMLASIIDVMKEKYRTSLTASIQHVKIFALPFQRSFPLDIHHERIISEEIRRCKKQGGCMLVTPQHRNSLLLRQYDSEDLRVAGLKETFIDIFDESDAVLHHSFQLVYAVGKQKPLVDGQTRWTMVEALLQILAKSDCPPIANARNDPDSMHYKPGKQGEFPSLRILPPFKQHQKHVGEALCKELIKNPPYAFRWLKRVAREEQVDLLVKLMARSDVPASDLIESDQLFQDYKSDILAARGCIAYGLLFYCLGARNRVDYGVDVSRKKMAVPFSASDTPKARADFSHPDVAIMYSCLFYLNEGLTKQQLKDAIVRLQRLGPSVQQTTYCSWIDAAVGEDPSRSKAVSTFDSHLKVDAENVVQLEAMFPFFRRSMKVISFWLNEFVFPGEMHVVPGRRVTSAWNLVDTSSMPMNNAMGVSGTDDNRFLLPTFVRQKDQAVPELRATNAQMIDCILKCTNSVVLLHDDILHSIWETLLRQCIELETKALIDVGGLMAGVSNKDAAKQFSELLSTQMYKNKYKDVFKGVVFYNTSSKCWDVFDLKTRAYHRLETSSLQAADCFVYYDESRCRGHDLQLKENACALVTLESGLTKDKFLQGCARMRQLRPCGQSIILGGTCETLSASDDVQSVLRKIMKNTASEIRKGTVELLGRGKSYAEFPKAVDIDVSLQALYSGAKSEYDSIADYAAAIVEEIGESDIIRQLAEKCNAIGAGSTVKVSHVAEECEQELENEEEAEEEMELQMTAATPFKEQDWNYEDVFIPGRGHSVPTTSITEAISWLLGSPLGDVRWSKYLYCTQNWKHTICASYKEAGGNFLRPVNAFLRMPDGRIVLISDYEANKLLPHWWRCMDTSNVKLGHISFVASKTWLGGDKDTHLLSADVRASAKLLHGYVHYEPGEMRHLITMFTATHPRNAIVELLQVRHRLRFLERSDLDEVLLMANEGGEASTPSKGGQFDDCESPCPPREINVNLDDQFADAEQPSPPKRQRQM